jgi:hypothetical protein
LVVSGDKPKLVFSSSDNLEEKLGNSYAYVLDYNVLKIGTIKILIPNYWDENVEIKNYEGIEEEIFNKIITTVSTVKYDISQNNPSEIFTLGGNCQAISLYLIKQFRGNNLDAEPVLDKGIDHMYVKVKVRDKSYFVDMVEHTIRRVS